MKDSLLPGFEPSEKDIIEMALAMPFEKKIEKAIMFFQTYCKDAYGAFSGGKDSCVIKGLAEEAGVSVRWFYNNTTIDPPELVQFIRDFHKDVSWNNPKIGLINRMVEKGSPPTRVQRWCCNEFKEQGGAGEDRKIIGVRISESQARAKRWSLITPDWKGRFYFYAPICYWTDEDVWEYIRSRNLPYCKLYDQGFKRLGCVGCPMSSSHRKSDFKRWPRYEKAWRDGFDRMFKKWKGVPTKKGEDRHIESFKTPEDFFNWWIEDEEEDVDQCVFESMMSNT